jgi:hypothetical protein
VLNTLLCIAEIKELVRWVYTDKCIFAFVDIRDTASAVEGGQFKVIQHRCLEKFTIFLYQSLRYKAENYLANHSSSLDTTTGQNAIRSQSCGISLRKLYELSVAEQFHTFEKLISYDNNLPCGSA